MRFPPQIVYAFAVVAALVLVVDARSRLTRNMTPVAVCSWDSCL